MAVFNEECFIKHCILSPDSSSLIRILKLFSIILQALIASIVERIQYYPVFNITTLALGFDLDSD